MDFIPIVEKEIPDEKIMGLKEKYMALFPSTDLWEELIGKYSDSSRAYHNLSHIYSMLEVQERAGIEASDQLLMAIWYHDIIYNSKKKDNEQQSADLFKKHWGNHFDTKTINKVETIILSTEKHYPLSDDLDIEIMLDLDLFILASPVETYKKYAQAVRKEYKWVPGILYKKGRKKVLASFLKRERIYFSDYFYDTFETTARHNLSEEIKNL